MERFSVLMSIYKQEKPEYLDQCLKSLLRQTTPANEWVIVEDGPLTEELYRVLDSYEREYPNLIKRLPLPENRGLGQALQAGVPACSYEWIARMDTDDVARFDRFEKQLAAISEDPDLDICGSQIVEFEGELDNVVAERRVPLTDEAIRSFQRRRDAFNHVSVMFRKSAVMQAGNYQSCPLMEDTYLWARMLLAGAKCKNLDEPLVYVRVGKDMFSRRGGYAYLKKYAEGRRKVLETGFISRFDYYYTVAVQAGVALAPAWLRVWIFKRLLHRRNRANNVA